MLYTATMEDIKAYLDKVEKGKITADSLPPCDRCNSEGLRFKIHAYRERRFLIIVQMIVQAVYVPLVRFYCLDCKKTFTFYPDFAVPHKHYTRQSITSFAENYIAPEETTYQQATMVTDEKSVPGYPEDGKNLAPSTIHRWVTALSGMANTVDKAINLICQKCSTTSVCKYLAQLTIPPTKYRRQSRKKLLLSCFRLLVTEAFFKATFHLSIFTELAISCGFS